MVGAGLIFFPDIHGMNVLCAATYEWFSYAECKSPQLMRVALTSASEVASNVRLEKFRKFMNFPSACNVYR